MGDWGKEPGTYLLCFRVEEPLRLSVGRLGEHLLEPGVYVYVGSAFGPGGLGARLRRHLRREKRVHWHIDHLTVKAPVSGVIAVKWARLEARWAGRLCHHPETSMPIAGFGAGDARPGECKAHLFAMPPETTLEVLEPWLLDDPWLRPLQESLHDDEAAEAAARELAREHGEALSHPLIHWLQAGDPDRRWWAARTLALTGGAEAVNALADVVAGEETDVRVAAIHALGELRAVEAVPALIRALGDGDGMVSSTAADSLARIGEGALPGLATALLEGEERVRVRAAYVLRKLLPEEDVAAVLALYKALDDPNYLVSSMAEEALTEMGYLNNFLFVP